MRMSASATTAQTIPTRLRCVPLSITGCLLAAARGCVRTCFFALFSEGEDARLRALDLPEDDEVLPELRDDELLAKNGLLYAAFKVRLTLHYTP